MKVSLFAISLLVGFLAPALAEGMCMQSFGPPGACDDFVSHIFLFSTDGLTTGDNDEAHRLGGKLYECEYDCDKDYDCEYGLLCADEHQYELKKAGLDPRKAYCRYAKPGYGFTKKDRKYGEVCYDPKKVDYKPPVKPPMAKKLQECEYDCDKDSDCAYGLRCADEHKYELEEAGLDPRKAYCRYPKPGDGFTKKDRKYGEVCYDYKKIY